MNFVANCVVEPSRHVASDELNRRHAANLIGISLPEGTMERPARFIASRFYGLGDFELFELDRGQSAIVHNHWHSRVRVHDTTEIRPRTRYVVSVAPEVAQLGPLSSDDEQGGPPTQRQPSFPGTWRVLAQPKFAERCAQSLP